VGDDRQERGRERGGEFLRRGGGEGPREPGHEIGAGTGGRLGRRRLPLGEAHQAAQRGPDRLGGAPEEEELRLAVQPLGEVGDDDEADVRLAQRDAEGQRRGVAGAPEDVLQFLELAVVDPRRGARHLQAVLGEGGRAEEHRLPDGVEEPEGEERMGKVGTDRAGQHLPPGVEGHLVRGGRPEPEDGDRR
jgi:hypothetical protein